MPAIKSIQINPDLLNISSKKSKTRKNRKREKKVNRNLILNQILLRKLYYDVLKNILIKNAKDMNLQIKKKKVVNLTMILKNI